MAEVNFSEFVFIVIGLGVLECVFSIGRAFVRRGVLQRKGEEE